MAQLSAERKQAELVLNTAKERLAEVNTEIAERLADVVKMQRQGNNKPDGSVSFTHGGVRIKATRTPRVSWDQNVMRDGVKQLQDMGEDVNEYVDTKLSITERRWKAWPEGVRKIFDGAREVKLSDEKFEFVESDK